MRAGLVGAVDVEGDVVGALVEVADVLDDVDVVVKAQGGVDGQERIVAVHVHAELDGGVGDEGADRAETHDTERLAEDLGADKGGLALFDDGRDLHAGRGLLAHPVQRAGDIARADQHGAQHQLLHGVGVGTGGGEHGDARLGAALDGDVVHAHARTGDGEQLGREVHVEELGRATMMPSGFVWLSLT